MIVIAAIGIPILGSFLVPLVHRYSPSLRNVLAILMILATLGCVLALIPLADQTEKVEFGAFIIPGLSFNFVVDGLGVYVALISSFIGLLILFYSLDYMRAHEHLGEYYFLVVLFLGAMVGLVFASNLLMLYMFWEITAICSWRLIGFYRKGSHLRNADTAFLVTVFGSFFMLVGLEMIWHETGTLNIAGLQGHSINPWAMAFLFLGILSKSAQVPLQIWLPAAGVAPSTVTALLHAAVLVVIGIFAFARVILGTLGLPVTWQVTMLIFAIVTILVTGSAALVENDAKRILAYSTIAQLAYILLGFAGMTSMSVAGGLLFLLAHSLAKAGLFLCVGIIEHQTHTRDIRQMGGLIKKMPVTAIAFILCALTIVGFPPTAGFFSKLMIIMGVLEGGHVVYAILAVFGSLLSLLYMIRLFTAVFLGEEHLPETSEGTPLMLGVVSAFAAFSIVVGLAATPIMNIVNAITAQLLR